MDRTMEYVSVATGVHNVVSIYISSENKGNEESWGVDRNGDTEYQKQIIANAKTMAEALAAEGFRIVAGGTDTHLMLVDVFTKKVTGRQAQETLECASITVNKNAIPFDANPPAVASGIRVGTPAVTTRGMKEPEMRQIARGSAKS